jgi:protein-disulfide isomerase-like protein with CxxC motif
MTPIPSVHVTEFTDPGCVWSWSSEPMLRWLRRRYGDQVAWTRVFGVQVDELSRTHPGADPVADAERFRGEWLAVAAHTAAPITAHLAWMHRSTRPACEAALAAEAQGTDVADAVLRRLREAVYVDGRPPDSPARVADALRGVPGLDLDALLELAADPTTGAAIDDHWARTRRPAPEVVDRSGPGPNPGAAKADGQHLRYGFPTLVVDGPGARAVLSGWSAPEGFAAEIERVAGGTLVVDSGPWDRDELLEEHGTLTLPELRLLAGSETPPARAIRVDTATTSLWVHPALAEARLADPRATA